MQGAQRIPESLEPLNNLINIIEESTGQQLDAEGLEGFGKIYFRPINNKVRELEDGEVQEISKPSARWPKEHQTAIMQYKAGLSEALTNIHQSTTSVLNGVVVFPQPHEDPKEEFNKAFEYLMEGFARAAAAVAKTLKRPINQRVNTSMKRRAIAGRKPSAKANGAEADATLGAEEEREPLTLTYADPLGAIHDTDSAQFHAMVDEYLRLYQMDKPVSPLRDDVYAAFGYLQRLNLGNDNERIVGVEKLTSATISVTEDGVTKKTALYRFKPSQAAMLKKRLVVKSLVPQMRIYFGLLPGDRLAIAGVTKRDKQDLFLRKRGGLGQR